MRVITFLNEKGGVGKTTLATHLAAALAAQGLAVLLVDTDPQGTATTAFGMDEWPGLYNLVVRGRAWKEVVRPLSADLFARDGMRPGTLLILGSNIETRAIPQLVDDASLLPRRLAEISHHVDWVVIDTPPTPSMLHGSAYLATDYVVYPTKLETWSVKAVVNTKSRLESANRQRKGFGLNPIESLGIVCTQTRLRTIDQQENLKALQKSFGDEVISEPLAIRTAWTEATSMSLPVWAVDADGAATAEMDLVFGEILEGART